jgi:hypothetical protein
MPAPAQPLAMGGGDKVNGILTPKKKRSQKEYFLRPQCFPYSSRLSENPEKLPLGCQIAKSGNFQRVFALF